MTLTFEDAYGRRGKVTETLEVEYDGSWEENVERYVRRVENDRRDDEVNSRTDDPYTRSVLDLPKRLGSSKSNERALRRSIAASWTADRLFPLRSVSSIAGRG